MRRNAEGRHWRITDRDIKPRETPGIQALENDPTLPDATWIPTGLVFLKDTLADFATQKARKHKPPLSKYLRYQLFAGTALELNEANSSVIQKMFEIEGDIRDLRASLVLTEAHADIADEFDIVFQRRKRAHELERTRLRITDEKAKRAVAVDNLQEEAKENGERITTKKIAETLGITMSQANEIQVRTKVLKKHNMWPPINGVSEDSTPQS